MSQVLIEDNKIFNGANGAFLYVEPSSPTIDLRGVQKLHIKCNDVTGTDVEDSEGTLTLTSTTDTSNISADGAASNTNTAFNLYKDSVAGRYIEGGYDASLETYTGAIAGWIKKPSVQYGPFLCFGNGLETSGLRGFTLYHYPNGANDTLYVAWQYQTPEARYHYTADSDWHHFVLQQTGSALELYWDGVSVAWGNNSAGINWIKSDSGPSPASPFTEYTKVYLGGARPSQSAMWPAGSLDDFRVFNRVLTQDEIDFLYNDGDGTEADHN